MKPNKKEVRWLWHPLDKQFLRRRIAAVNVKSWFSASEKEFRSRVRRLRRSGLFNEVWYRKQTQAGADAIAHYLRKGAAKGFDPNPFFDSDCSTTVRRQRRFGCGRGRCQRTNPGSRLCCAEARTDFPFSHLLDRPYASRSEHA